MSNRTLKFRAWDFERKCWLNQADTFNELNRQSRWGEHKYPIMQYTGLKDKNGKEIYEGDICATESKDYPMNKKVVWNESMACFEFDYPLGKSILSRNYIEVIGNIYENPELIKKQPA